MPQTYLIVEGEGDQPGFLSDYNQYGEPIGSPFYQFPGALSEGYIQGNRFYVGPNDIFGTLLGETGTNFYEVSENGDVRLQVGTGWGNINRGTSLTTEYGIAGSVNITTEQGEYLLPITFAKLSRTGARWAEYTNPLTGETSNHMVPANMTLEALNAQTPGWTRWLSAEEVVGQSLAGYLYRLASSQDPAERAIFESLLDAMGITREEFDNDASGSVEGWVQANQYNLSAASRYVFAGGR